MAEIFVSLSRKDKDWGDWVAWQLRAAGHQVRYQHWQFQTGQNFLMHMDEAGRAERVLVLVSPSYFTSDFTMLEMTQAITRDPRGLEGVVVPVIVRPYDLRGHILGTLLCIDLTTAADDDEASSLLLEGLKRKGPPATAPAFPVVMRPPASPTPAFPQVSAARELAVFHGVPRLPPQYVPRGDVLARVKHALLAADDSTPALAAVIGMSGSGKSVMAAAVARDAEIWARFPDGVVWFTLGREVSITQLQSELVRALCSSTQRQSELVRELCRSSPMFETLEDGRVRVLELTRDRACLIVIDDVWDGAQAVGFNRVGSRSGLLLTTRLTRAAEKIGAHEVRLEQLDQQAAVEFLARCSGIEASHAPPEASAIAERCGYLPLALATVGSLIRKQQFDWKSALVAVTRADVRAMRAVMPEYEHDSVLAALAAGIKAVPDELASAFRDLAVFPEDATIPEGALGVIWEPYLDPVGGDPAGMAQELVDCCLLTRLGHRSYRLHDLYFDYLQATSSNIPILHRRLVESYSRRFDGQWGQASNDKYFFERYPFHMLHAGLREEFSVLVCDLGWLRAKLEALGIGSVLEDFKLAHGSELLATVGAALRLSAHALAQRNGSQLISQLYGRLHWTEPGIPRMEEQWNAATGWLRLLTPTLATPADPLIQIFDSRGARSLAVTETGTVVSGGKDVRVWDLATGVERFAFSNDDQTGSGGSWSDAPAMALMPDQRCVIVCAGVDLAICNLVTGEVERAFESERSPHSVAITPDGRRLVQGFDRSVSVWNVDGGCVLYRIERLTTAIAMSRGGSCFLAGGGTIDRLNVETGLVSPGFHCEAQVRSLVVTPDASTVIAGGTVGDEFGREPSIRSYDVASGRPLRQFLGHTFVTDWYSRSSSAQVNALALTPDGTKLVSAAGDQTVRLWNVATGEMLAAFDHPGTAVAVAVMPDGRAALSTGYDDTIRVWRLSDVKSNTGGARHKGPIRAVAFSPDGRWLVSGGDDLVARLWDTTTWAPVAAFEGHRRTIRAVAFTPDSRYVITAGLDHAIRVWEIPSGRLEHTFEGHSYCVRGLAVTPDGRNVVSGAEDSTIGIWRLQDAREQYIFFPSGHGEVQAVALTPDGRTVVFSDQGGRVHAMQLETGDQVLEMGGSRDVAQSVAVTADGTRVVWGTTAGSIEVWSLHDGRQLLAWSNGSPVHSIAVTTDGRVISGDAEGTIRIAHVDTGRCLASFTVDSPDTIVAVSRDGRAIAAGDRSGRVHALQLS